MATPVLATVADLAKYVPAGSLAGVALDVQERALTDASGEAYNYIPDQAATPLVAPFDPALVRHVCWLAMWQIMSARGFSVEEGSNRIFGLNRDAALAWLTKLARREITLNSNGARVPGTGGPRVLSATPRGWGNLPIR